MHMKLLLSLDEVMMLRLSTDMSIALSWINELSDLIFRTLLLRNIPKGADDICPFDHD